jgi:hypothetical protein
MHSRLGSGVRGLQMVLRMLGIGGDRSKRGLDLGRVGGCGDWYGTVCESPWKGTSGMVEWMKGGFLLGGCAAIVICFHKLFTYACGCSL